MDEKKKTLWTVSGAARVRGIPRTTLLSAIAKEQCEAVWTGDGIPLVTMADIDAWLATPRKPGRPKALRPV